MKIAVVGGTGVLGREVARQLSACAHDARVLSRRSAAFPVDLTTGAGLDRALAGCEVVVDASNDATRHAGALCWRGPVGCWTPNSVRVYAIA